MNTEFLTRVFDLNPGEASPAECLDLIVGTDPEGFPEYLQVRVGDLLWSKSRRDQVVRVVGFCKDNTILAQPHGLGHDPMVKSYRLRANEDLEHFAPEVSVGTRHKDGLVVFN